MPDPTVEPQRQATLTATLHVETSHVHAWDLFDPDRGDLVSLDLGDEHAKVSLLGTLSHVMEVVAAAAKQLMVVAEARPEAAE